MSQVRSRRPMLSMRAAVASAAVAGSLLLALVPAASAAAPTVDTWSNPRYGPYLDCPTFAVFGDWTVSHRLTTFFTNAGTPIRDIEVVTFRGRFVNPENDKWVPDSGRTVYFDTLDADFNFLTTMANTQRTSAYVHGAGRRDFQLDSFRGLDGESAVNVAALCAALGD
jgi:hypothetical protein